MSQSSSRRGPKPDINRALAILVAVGAYTSGAHAAPTVGNLVPILEHLFPESSPFTYSKAKRMTDYALEIGLVKYVSDEGQTKAKTLAIVLGKNDLIDW